MICAAPRAAKAVTFQNVSRDSFLGDPSASKRNSVEKDRAEISFKSLQQAAATPTPEGTQQGQLRQFEFTAAASTIQNPYSKVCYVSEQPSCLEGSFLVTFVTASLDTCPLQHLWNTIATSTCSGCYQSCESTTAD
jgi:hypothetical protein